MNYKTQVLGLKEFRQDITSLWKKARKNNVRYIILYHSMPIMEVNPLDEKEFILEKLAADVSLAREQAKKGRIYSQKEVYKKLGL